MAKQGGMGDIAYVDGYDLGGDITALSRIGGGPAAGDVTGIKKSAFERVGLLRDGAIEFTSAFNDENVGPALGAHQVLKTLPTADRLVSYSRGQAVGASVASLVSKQINYDATRAADGSLFFAVSAQGNGYGLAWGNSMTAGTQSASSGVTNSGVDFAAATAFGAVAFVHVTSFTGTSAFIGLNHSNDNGGADPYAALDGGSLELAVTGIGGARMQTSSTTTSVKRWLQLYVSGVFTQISFMYSVVKFQSAQT